MKSNFMKIAFLVFFAALTSIFIAIAWPFAKAAFLAFTLAIVFSPLQARICRWCKGRDYIAAFLTTLIVGICVIMPLGVVGSMGATKAGYFLNNVVSRVEAGSLAQTFDEMLTSVNGWVEGVTGSSPPVEEFRQTILGGLKAAGTKFYELSPRFIKSVLSIAANFILMFLFLVVFFAEGRSIKNWFRDTAPLSHAHWDELANDVRTTIVTSIGAAMLIALTQGTLLGIGYWIAGFEEPYGWWLISVIACLIPVVGATSCYVIASIVLFAAGNMKGGIIFMIYGFGFVSSIDNLIRPLVIRGTSRMHPVLLFVTLIGAVRLFGLIGLLIGPVLLSVFLASLRIYRREFANL